MKQKLEYKILSVIFGIIVVSILVGSAVVLYVERADIYFVATERLGGSAGVIMKGIEHTMLTADPEVTRRLVKDLQGLEGFESIEVYNAKGKEAFDHGASPLDAETIGKIVATGESLTVEGWDSLTFYMPLLNQTQCNACHGTDTKVLGAVRVSVSLKKEKDRITRFMVFVLLGSLGVMVVMGVLFRGVIRKFVIKPVLSLEEAAYEMAHGDLSFQTDITSEDEIGRLDSSIKKSLASLSGILDRVKEVSGRISNTADMVQKDSDKVVEGTQVEAEAVSDISSSVEQLNSAITEVSDSTESLATSVEESAASIEQMASSISAVTKITHELTGGIDETSSSIGEMSASIREIAKNAEDLSAVSEETLSAIDEIISSIKEVEQHARESAALSEKVTEDASTLGVASIGKTMEGMRNIKAAVEKTSETIHKLGGRSDEIGNILTVIEEITDQTTLLALNAAILAAQAGEHGKGFSVVAGEIKDLAERTAFSTQEIAQLIQSVRQEVKEAVDSMEDGMTSVNEGLKLTKDASTALHKILESSKKSSEMSNSIKRTTGEQVITAKSVSEAMERVRNMVDQIANSTGEQSKGVSLIMQASDRMRDAAHQVDVATEQQAAGSRQISQAVEVVSDRTQEISRAIYEQKIGSKQIWSSVEKVKNIPRENRDLAFRINHKIQELLSGSDLLVTEMRKFKLYKEEAGDGLVLGIVPLENPAEMYRRLAPVAEYLGAETGKKVELRVASSYEAAEHDLADGIVHMSFMTPFTYVEVKSAQNVELLAIALRGGTPFNHSVIIAKEDSPVESLSDLKGRSFAFGDPHSTTGHLVPKAMLAGDDVTLNDLSYFNYLGHHDAVVKAVLKGEFDAGAVTESVAKKYKDQGLRFVKVSEEIPEFNFCAGAGMDEADRDAVRAALLKLNDKTPEGAAVLAELDKSYTGFQETSDREYESIRQIVSKLETQK